MKTGFSYSNEIAMIPGCMRRCVETFDNKGPEIARKLKGVSNFLVIAHGPNLSTAQEAAMGLTQATGLPAQGFLLEEYLHGQVQSLSAESSVMIIASPGPCIERLTRFTDVAKIIGAQVMLFAPEDSPSCIDNDECIPLPGGVNEVLTPAFYCTPFWYIVYHLSLLYREDPDRLSMDKSAFRESGLGQYKKEFV
jgi:glucosamine 6-phosphate synthetase-like amidotransferase/phosphosugar isomerase protein